METIQVTLDRKDIINLIKGTEPSYTLMEDPIIEQMGTFIGGFSDRWDWNNSKFQNFTITQLWSTYLKLKEGK